MNMKPLDCYGPQINGLGKIDIGHPQLPPPSKKKRASASQVFAGLSYRTKDGGWFMIIDTDACDLANLPEPAEDQ